MQQIINWINEDLIKLEKSGLHIYNQKMYNELKNSYNSLLSRLVDYENALSLQNVISFNDELMKIKIEYAELSASFDFFLQYQGGISKITNAQKQKVREDLVKISGKININNYEEVNNEFCATVNLYKNSKVDFTNDPQIAKIIDFFNYTYLKYKLRATKSFEGILIPSDKIISFIIDDVNKITNMENIDEDIKNDLKKYTINANFIIENIDIILSLISFSEMNLSYIEIQNILNNMDAIEVTKVEIRELVNKYKNFTNHDLYIALGTFDIFKNIVGVTINYAKNNSQGLDSYYFQGLKNSRRFNEKKYVVLLYKYCLMYLDNKYLILSAIEGFRENYPAYKSLFDEQEIVLLQKEHASFDLSTAIYENQLNNERVLKVFLDNYYSEVIINIADKNPELIKKWMVSATNEESIKLVFSLLLDIKKNELVVDLANEMPNKNMQKIFIESIIDSKIDIDSPIHNANNSQEEDYSNFNVEEHYLTKPLTIYYLSRQLRKYDNIEGLAKKYNQYLLDWKAMVANYNINNRHFGLLKYLYKYQRDIYYDEIKKIKLSREIALNIISINSDAIEELFDLLNWQDYPNLSNDCLDIICKSFEPYVKDEVVDMYENVKNNNDKLLGRCLAYIMHKGLINFEFLMILQAMYPKTLDEYKKKCVLNVKDSNKRLALLKELKNLDIEINNNDYRALIHEGNIDFNNPKEVLQYKKYLKDCIEMIYSLDAVSSVHLAKIVGKSNFEDIVKYFVNKCPQYINIVLENITNEELYNYILELELNMDESMSDSNKATHK